MPPTLIGASVPYSDPEADQATSNAFPLSGGTGAAIASGAAAAGLPAPPATPQFDQWFSQSGLPPSFYNTAKAQFGQESSYGRASSNPMQVTSGTAAKPGYNMPPLPAGEINDPNVSGPWALKWEAALAKSRGLDLSTPQGRLALLQSYNGGGDPNYAQHVAARSPTGGVDIAQNGTSDGPDPAATALAAKPAAPAANTPSALSYTPPPMPQSVSTALNDSSGLTPTNRSRDLLTLASGLLQGPTLGAGLGRGLAGVVQNQQNDRDTALRAWELENTQALYGLNAQRYGLGLGIQQQNAYTKAAGVPIAQQNADTKSGNLGEKVRHDGVTEGQGAARVGVAQTNAGANVARANAAAAQAGTPGVPVAPAPDALPDPSLSATSLPQLPAQTGTPAVSGAAASAPVLPGVGASGLSTSSWPSVGSNVSPLIGLRAQNQQRILNNKQNAKESDEDTGAIENLQAQDTLIRDQADLIQQHNQGATFPTGGLLGRIGGEIASVTGDPTAASIEKNTGRLLIGGLPHGVGALRIPEINAVKASVPGMGVPEQTVQNIRDQTVAANQETMDVLQARQNWLQEHPGESAAVGFDPIGNDYLRTYPAYSATPDGKVAIPLRPSLLSFAQEHTQNGRYASPTGGSDPEADAAATATFGKGVAAPASDVATSQAGASDAAASRPMTGKTSSGLSFTFTPGG